MSRTLASGKKASEWVLFEKGFTIPDYDNPNQPSRIRWRLFSCPYFGLYLHRWYKPDPRPTIHNHPWPFLSIILKGNYVDEGYIHTDKYSPRVFKSFWNFNFFWNWVPRHAYHTVTQVAPGTLSLMFVGRDTGAWGYLDEDFHHIPYQDHWHTQEFKRAMRERSL